MSGNEGQSETMKDHCIFLGFSLRKGSYIVEIIIYDTGKPRITLQTNKEIET